MTDATHTLSVSHPLAAPFQHHAARRIDHTVVAGFSVPREVRLGVHTVGSLRSACAERPRERRGAEGCRLPVSSARKLKFYDRRDLNDLVRNHLEEKQQVLDENNCLRTLLLERLNIGDEELENALVSLSASALYLSPHISLSPYISFTPGWLN